jgi:TP901 family phage tail tape measure protein
MNVSEFTDISTATDALISSIQAFKYTAAESMDVVDILNTIGNNYAISTADLATSLTKSSGSLVAANGTLEEAVALTATANTIMQDADVVGTALKTVAMRLRGTDVKVMEEEGVETDGAATSTSKLRGKIKALSGVDILTDTGAYKSTYQILSEIANVWEDIDDMDQAALLELIAGKRAGSVMSAILQNPETLKDSFESANKAAGSAWEENEKYLDSFQGRLDLFNNAIQTMWNNTLNDDLVKGIIDVGTALVKWVDNLGLIKTLFIAIGAIMIKKHFKGDLLGGLGGGGNSVAVYRQKLADLQAKEAEAEARLTANPRSRIAQLRYGRAHANVSKYQANKPQMLEEYDDLNEQLAKAQSNLDKAQARLDNYKGDNKNTMRSYKNQVKKAQEEVNNLTNKVNTAKQKIDESGMSGQSAGKKVWSGFKAAGKAVASATKAVVKFGKQKKVCLMVDQLQEWNRVLQIQMHIPVLT